MKDAWTWLIANLETVLNLIQLVGIPIAILIYFFNKRKERRDRDYGTYDSLDDKYIDYLQLCLEYPHLDVADIRRDKVPGNTTELSPDDKRAERIMFSVLLSIMERAYLMYKDGWYNVKEEQWNGWEGYIRDWLKRTNFKNALPDLKPGFDQRFVDYLDDLEKQQAK